MQRFRVGSTGTPDAATDDCRANLEPRAESGTRAERYAGSWCNCDAATLAVEGVMHHAR